MIGKFQSKVFQSEQSLICLLQCLFYNIPKSASNALTSEHGRHCSINSKVCNMFMSVYNRIFCTIHVKYAESSSRQCDIPGFIVMRACVYVCEGRVCYISKHAVKILRIL